jgi:16S rRNA (cytosine967-C5)-methyltransferase
MTPQARVQAAIEVLDLVIGATRDGGAAADTLIGRYFRDRRYAGAKDRRAVRDLVYAAIRRAGERPENGRAAMLALADADPAVADLFDGAPHGPPPISAEEPRAAAGPAPAWLAERLPAEELAALAGRAPLDLRVNRLRADRASVIAALGGEPTPHAPEGLRLPESIQIEQHPLFVSGAVEVQDEGSQLVALACAVRPGMTVVDLCAGAGGKTLALAAEMDNRGRIVACDADRSRLARLSPRAERAGVTIVETRLLDARREAAALADLADEADVVLVDAPCSGTGTWRRNPEARWRITPQRLDAVIATQAHLLDLAAPLVRPGGRLVYAVCTLLDAEGPDQAAAFLDRHPGWVATDTGLAAGVALGAGRRLSPAADGTDGFFVAAFTRPW